MKKFLIICNLAELCFFENQDMQSIWKKKEQSSKESKTFKNHPTTLEAGIPDHAVPAFGECVGGTLPTRCKVRHLKHFNWKLTLS